MGIELLAALTVGLSLAMFAAYVARQMQLRPADARISRLADRPQQAAKGLAWDEIRRRGASNLPLLNRILTDSPWATRLTQEIEQAGLKIRVGEYLLVRFAVAMTAFIGVWVLGRSAISFLIGLACGAIGWALPAVWLSILRKRRVDKISRQMPEAVSLLANSLRAGFAFQHGIDTVSKELPPPISDEFARILIDLNIGATIEEALQGFLQRAESEDANLVVTAILIQRNSGGNLAEVLEIVGETMRERERLLGEVRTMTAQQRFSGTVLSLWPILLLGFMSLINWHGTVLLFTTTIGQILLGIWVTLQIAAMYSIRKILDIDV